MAFECVGIETYNDMATFASHRQPAWHGLGTVFDEPVTTAEMLALAHLDNWNVHLVESTPVGRYHADRFDIVRDNPFDGVLDTLGFAGSRYKVFQNEQLFGFGDAILDGGDWETAGSLRNGTVVFGSLALNREVVLDPNGANDVIKSYLLVHTSHDGSLSIQASTTPVRVVCQNTFTMAVGARGGKAKQSFKIRHTQTAEGKVAAAREALGIANQFLDEFDTMAQAMIQKQVDSDAVEKILDLAYPKPEKDSKGSFTKWENKRDSLYDIYVGETCDNVYGTAWGVFNALTERLDWFRTPRNGETESVLAAASGFDDVTNKEKARLLNVVNQVVFA